MNEPARRTSPSDTRPIDGPHADEAAHTAIAGLLAAWVDGELPADTAAQMDRHVAACLRCQREVRLQRQLAATLGQTQGPVASAALQTRLRQTLATTTVPSARPDVPRLRWALGLALVGMVVLGVLWRVASVGPRAGVPPAVSSPRPLTAEPLLDSVLALWSPIAARDLPGRARDLGAVREAIGMPITPLLGPDLSLAGAWTTTVDGELVGVLAYRHVRGILLQFVIPDAMVFRSARLRAAVANTATVTTQADSVSLLGWPTAGGMSVLTGPLSLSELVALQGAVDATSQTVTREAPRR